MNARHFLASAAFLAGALTAPAAFAHTFGAHGYGFAEGFLHPFLGIDHLLAMVAVGLWAAQLGGAALWRVPLAFVAVMAIGALCAQSGVSPTFLEAAIAASVLALGILVACRLRVSGVLSLLLAALFAVSHGYAHGLEMPQAAAPSGYGLGFMLATASLHGLGILIGLGLGRQRALLRTGGAAIALAGLWLMTTA